MSDRRRQFRAAAILILIIMPIGIIGFMAIEGLSLIEATWLMIITLTTIGYGDISAATLLGKIFTICLVLVGLGALTFFLSSSFALLFSSEAVTRRRKRQIRRKISKLNSHYIICGAGEMVDKTIGYVLQGAQIRLTQHQKTSYAPIKRIMTRLFGKAKGQRGPHRLVHRIFIVLFNLFAQYTTLLDLIVVVTEDMEYAHHLRSAGILVVEGDPSDDDTLLAAGIHRARSLVVMRDQDTEGLLTVLSARNINPNLYITAAAIDDEFKVKMIRVGANIVLAPYEVAGQFLNSATLRPAVNDYFSRILYDQETHHQITQLELGGHSPWIGKSINDLQLRRRFDAVVIGIRQASGDFVYVPNSNRTLRKNDVLLSVAPGPIIPKLQGECRQNGRAAQRSAGMQRLVQTRKAKTPGKIFNLIESEAAIESMGKHFVICGTDHIIQNAVSFLDPSRPFVLISDDRQQTETWLQRGFRVTHGNPTREETLRKAGVERALAIMISIPDKASALLTVLTARGMSKSLLISVTAPMDDMIEKLRRSGADRIVSPFHVAAQFVLLSTTRPEVAEFLQHVLYNEVTGLETAELYMEDDSPWIGKTIESLQLRSRFHAGVIGIRQPDRQTFIYAPPLTHEIQAQEVLIIVTPMKFFDEMRALAISHQAKRPATLRLHVDTQTSGGWSRDMIRELIKQQDES